MPTDSFVLDLAIGEFRQIKSLGEKGISQLTDDQLHQALDAETNSVAIIMRHMAGNMRSRWVGFLTSDGEKPDRMRDHEFEDVRVSRAELLAEWEHGWQCLFDALAPLTDADLSRPVVIREEPLSVLKAINRQMTHYAGHTYQMLLLARHWLGPRWQTPSIPRGRSEEFNRRMLAKRQAQRG